MSGSGGVGGAQSSAGGHQASVVGWSSQNSNVNYFTLLPEGIPELHEESALSRRLLETLGPQGPQACSTNFLEEETEAQRGWKMNDQISLVLCFFPTTKVFLSEQKKEIR